jgi:hypothetical protein
MFLSIEIVYFLSESSKETFPLLKKDYMKLQVMSRSMA